MEQVALNIKFITQDTKTKTRRITNIYKDN